FARAHANFYDAARLGLEAELTWLGPDGEAHRGGGAGLGPRLVPGARRGLGAARLAATEADRLLGVIADRVAAGQTGAVWQRRTLAALEGRPSGGLKPSPPEGRDDDRDQALERLLERYLELQAA